MKNLDRLRTILFDYIMVVVETTLSFGIVGCIVAPHKSISFAYFFAPFILGAICMLPCIPIYVKEDMTIKQIMIQRIAELVVLEAAMCYSAKLILGDDTSGIVYVAVMCSTAFFDILSYLMKWFLEKNEADHMNKVLKELRERDK